MVASLIPISLLDIAHISLVDSKSPCNPVKFIMADVVALAQTGDDAAFSALYEQHKKRVFAICMRIVRDFSLAEDLTQDIFLQVHRKIASFRGDSVFTTWLHRLAVNTVLMHLRKRTLPVVSIDNLEINGDHIRADQYLSTRDLAQAGAIDRLAINHAVASLRPDYRSIFLLHYVHGFDHGEIASMLNYSRGSIKSKLYKARQELRGALAVQSMSKGTPSASHANDPSHARTYKPSNPIQAQLTPALMA